MIWKRFAIVWIEREILVFKKNAGKKKKKKRKSFILYNMVYVQCFVPFVWGTTSTMPCDTDLFMAIVKLVFFSLRRT